MLAGCWDGYANDECGGGAMRLSCAKCHDKIGGEFGGEFASIILKDGASGSGGGDDGRGGGDG